MRDESTSVQVESCVFAHVVQDGQFEEGVGDLQHEHMRMSMVLSDQSTSRVSSKLSSSK
jgi:hypothetical protein